MAENLAGFAAAAGTVPFQNAFVAGAGVGLERRRLDMEQELQPYRITTLQQQQQAAEFQMKREQKRAELEDEFMDMMQREMNAQKAAEFDSIAAALRPAPIAPMYEPGDFGAEYPDSLPYGGLLRRGPMDAAEISAPTLDDFGMIGSELPDELVEIEAQLGSQRGTQGLVDKALTRLSAARSTLNSSRSSARERDRAEKQIEYLESRLPELRARAALESEAIDMRADLFAPRDLPISPPGQIFRGSGY